jgi:hypothetical protein
MQKTVKRSGANPIMGIESPAEARRIVRAGDYTGHTAGVAPDYVQGNLCILPKDMALEVAAFCQRNPRRHRHPHRRALLPRVQGRQTGRRAQ